MSGVRVLGGRYEVQDRIGTGGMATVYRGLDEVLGRTVAIKTMLPQYAADPSFAARFKQEAQAAAALQSPYIVSVYDWGKDGDTYYIVMEYLRGTDLKSGIRRHGALDCKKVAQIGSQIAQALSVAHKHDIIHRDIKPQNIMVQPDGNIKVMDFGIARAKNSHLTTDNSVLGTAHYVSPEQTQGKELGPTTDIYSLGIVMYEAATGQVPFQGDDAITVALKQVNEQPKPPSQLNPKVDPQLEAIILKCMQKNPADRFQTANELYRTLRDYLAGRTEDVNEATATLNLPVQTTNRIGRVPVGTDATVPVARVNTQRYRQQSATEQVAQAQEERKRSRRRNAIIGAVVAVVVAAVAAFFAWGYLSSATDTYEVPNLVSLTEEQAKAELESDEHFSLGSVKESYSDSVPEGVVMEQTPNARRMMPDGTAIDLVISRGPEPAETVTVPDLTDMTPSEVRAALEKYNLTGQQGDSVYDDEIEADHVVKQDPEAGSTAKAGDVVTYYLSKGKEDVDVPNVVGEDESTARKKLSDAGFEVSVSTSSSETVASGKVISQSPSSGTLEKGGTVSIVVSQGSSMVTVPNVVGWNYATAQSNLEELGLNVTLAYEHSSTAPANTVIAQSLSGKVSPGSDITLSVSLGSNTPSEDSGSSS